MGMIMQNSKQYFPVATDTPTTLSPLWRATDVINNEYINGSTGATVSDSSSARTDYIEVTGGETISIMYFTNWASANYAAYYDENKTYISGMGLTKNVWNVLTVPSNAKYFRLSAEQTNMTTTSYTRIIGFAGNVL